MLLLLVFFSFQNSFVCIFSKVSREQKSCVPFVQVIMKLRPHSTNIRHLEMITVKSRPHNIALYTCKWWPIKNSTRSGTAWSWLAERRVNLSGERDLNEKVMKGQFPGSKWRQPHTGKKKRRGRIREGKSPWSSTKGHEQSVKAINERTVSEISKFRGSRAGKVDK